MSDINQYTGLVTSEHNQKSKFMALIAASLQPFVDLQNNTNSIQSLFDVETAVGDQLDKLGQWIGVSRNITTPIAGVYFSFGVAGQGWGQGTWFNPLDAIGGLTILPDDSYRILVKATIAENSWDGTIPGAYAIWALVFALEPFQILIQDNLDMTITIVLLTSSVIDAVALALITGGYIVMRPAGVRITGYNQVAAPVFGFGAQTATVAGWGTGNWI